MSPATPTSTAKRKKWTEEEERSLISKYSELQSSGALSRLRTREKKFRPVADHVTAAHHGVDPTAYPFSWTWKDACTKAHNMRHQYLLVKQKLLSAAASSAAHQGPDSSSDLSWTDGLSLWPNFLVYKEVFGDAPLPTRPLDDFADLGFDVDEEEGGGGGEGGGGFDCDEGVEVGPAATAEDEERPKKMKSKKNKKKKRKVRVWGEEEDEEEEEERAWEERMERRRAEWRKRVEEMLGHHRLQMAQIQARVLNEQQAVIGQLLGLVSHLAAAGGGGGVGSGVDGAHVNTVAAGIPGENRGGFGSGDGQEEQFILDG